MTDGEKKPGELSSLMAAVASIVEAVMEGHGLNLPTQKPSPWKAAHREGMAQDQLWRDLSWNRA